MICNRWPTPAEVEAHPDGREGWWVLAWEDCPPVSAVYAWQPFLRQGEEVLAMSATCGPPDTALAIHRGAPLRVADAPRGEPRPDPGVALTIAREAFLEEQADGD